MEMKAVSILPRGVACMLSKILTIYPSQPRGDLWKPGHCLPAQDAEIPYELYGANADAELLAAGDRGIRQ
jgi:hypothetical protein